MRGLSDTSAFDSFERMTQKVDQIEAESEASAELGGELTGDTLAQKFKSLEAGPGSDNALAELKAKMGLGPAPEARAALPSASSPQARVSVEEEVSVDASAPASNKR
jgi:phage shock protein A